MPRKNKTDSMIVLAVDVGLRITGYVVCRVKGTHIELREQGQVKTDSKTSLAERLTDIYRQLDRVSEKHAPQGLILETLYSHHRHPVTLGVLAQVRGVVVLLGRQRGMDQYEFSPTKARKALLGKGSADSARVKKMAETVMGCEMGSEHIADAFSLVVAFSHARKAETIRAQALK